MDSNSVIVIKEASNMITTFWPEIIGSSITGCFILLTAYLAYKYGLKTYFKQREHEQIIKRYLDEGVDRVLAAVDQASGVFIDNYLKAGLILGRVQEEKEVDASVRFRRFDRHILELIPRHKIMYLVGDQIFGKVIASLLGFVDGRSDVLEKEFQQLRYIITKKGQQARILEEMKKSLDDSYKKLERYFLLSDELQRLASILEKQTNLSWADLDKFKSHPEVRASVKRLKDRFESEL